MRLKINKRFKSIMFISLQGIPTCKSLIYKFSHPYFAPFQFHFIHFISEMIPSTKHKKDSSLFCTAVHIRTKFSSNVLT